MNPNVETPYYGYVDFARFYRRHAYFRLDLARPDHRFSSTHRSAVELLEVEIDDAKHSHWGTLRAGGWIAVGIKPGSSQDGTRGRYYRYERPEDYTETPAAPIEVVPRYLGGTPTHFANQFRVDASNVSIDCLQPFEQMPAKLAVNVVNVGQASCIAMLGLSGGVEAYFDVGWPICGNAKTRPSSLQFCTTNNPPVILSHWDMDHWAGANVDPLLLEVPWVVPTLAGLSKSAAEVARILAQNGNLFVWSDQPNIVRTTSSGISIARARGSTRNHSGLVIQVHEAQGLDVLCPGDCDYRKLPNFSTRPSVLVVSHHGGYFIGTVPPKAIANGWHVVSYGQGNTYNHPHRAAMAGLGGQGWTDRRDTPNGTVSIATQCFSAPCNRPHCVASSTQHF